MKKTPTPRIFRILLPAKDLEQAQRFYESLLGARGRRVGGGRIYFDCGAAILGILDPSAEGEKARSKPSESLYFATDNIEELHRRARKLGCLSPGLIHRDPANPLAEVVVRPWGERSFYVEDPSGNPLCFVDSSTLFTGTPRQVRVIGRAMGSRPSVRPPPRPARSKPRSRPRSRS